VLAPDLMGEVDPPAAEAIGHRGHSSPWPPTVVVVAYGSEDHLSACLDTLGPGLPVVVVDNGLSDKALRLSESAGATYVRPHANIGFAAAVNVALREHRPPGSDVLLLNPDALLKIPDILALRDELHRSDVLAAVGPRLTDPAGAAQKELWPIPSPWLAVAAIFGVADHFSRRRFVSGAVLFLRSDAVNSVGHLDERFFLYAEESDWQLRALRAGWQVGLAPKASAIHLSGGTSADTLRRQLLFNASAEHFVRKWYGNLGWQVFRIASILTALRRFLLTRDAEERAMQRRAMNQYLQGPVRSRRRLRDVT
jgi:GT2 family glycosyltransferase